MHKNRNKCVCGVNVVLVPYRKCHVLKYHQWMQSEELQILTASEPLSLEEEYQMQQSWLNDELKCTFIVLDSKIFRDGGDDVAAMIGDVNLFFNNDDNSHSAEIEIMIAEPASRGKGRGKEALLLMMKYGIDHLSIEEFTAKIGLGNDKSLLLFDKLGFVEVARSNVFQEVTLALNVDESVRNAVLKQTSESRLEEWP